MFPLRDDRPTYSPPVVTTLLIVACALVFFRELMLDEFSRNYFIERWGLVPARLVPVTLLTSLFLHGGWFHIIGNMLFLWAFGKSLEDALGHTKFLIFYLVCGVLAGITHIYFNPDSTMPTVGASGAIAGVMGAYLLQFPRARIHTLVLVFFFLTTIDIPAPFILVYWFIVQVVSGYGSIAHTHVTDTGVAWFAHIGGFLSGMVLVKLLGTRPRYFPRQDYRWR
jgi:membrane associated rhomboid family serine protease